MVKMDFVHDLLTFLIRILLMLLFLMVHVLNL